MGRMFMATIDEPAATTQRDLLELTAPAGGGVIVHEVMLTTDIETDANEEQIELLVSRFVGAFTAGSVSLTTATGYALGLTGATEDGSTVTHGATTQATGGTQEILGNVFINNRIGWHYLPTPEARVTVAATDAFVVQMQAAAATSTAFGGYVIYEELVA